MTFKLTFKFELRQIQLSNGNEADDLLDDLVWRDTVCMSFVAKLDSVSKTIINDGSNVVGRHIVPTFEPGVRTGDLVQGDSTAGADADMDPAF